MWNWLYGAAADLIGTVGDELEYWGRKMQVKSAQMNERWIEEELKR